MPIYQKSKTPNRQTNTHTDRQTNRTDNITSFDFVGGGNKLPKSTLPLENITKVHTHKQRKPCSLHTRNSEKFWQL